jgi:hypothetical protein
LPDQKNTQHIFVECFFDLVCKIYVK